MRVHTKCTVQTARQPGLMKVLFNAMISVSIWCANYIKKPDIGVYVFQKYVKWIILGVWERCVS